MPGSRRGSLCKCRAVGLRSFFDQLSKEIGPPGFLPESKIPLAKTYPSSSAERCAAGCQPPGSERSSPGYCLARFVNSPNQMTNDQTLIGIYSFPAMIREHAHGQSGLSACPEEPDTVPSATVVPGSVRSAIDCGGCTPAFVRRPLRQAELPAMVVAQTARYKQSRFPSARIPGSERGGGGDRSAIDHQTTMRMATVTPIAATYTRAANNSLDEPTAARHAPNRIAARFTR